VIGLLRTIGLVGAAAVLAAGTAGCSGRNHGGGAGIILTNANVYQPPATGQTTVGYLDVTNNGPNDQVLSVTTSVGGKVVLRGPVNAGASPVVMQTVASISLPADTTTELIPTGYHLLISGARAMHDGKDIQLTFRFAHAAPLTTYALVTNPQNGGSSYFLN
jgi:copper(I)-binding protein